MVIQYLYENPTFILLEIHNLENIIVFIRICLNTY